MVSQRHETTWVLAGTGGGFFLAMLVLVSGFAVVTLAMVLVMAAVVFMPVTGVVAAGLGMRAAAKRRALAGAPIAARVVEVSGSCARGIDYSPGREFTFGDGRRVTPKLCGPMLNGLLPYIQKLRSGENGHQAQVQCPLSGSVTRFELRIAQRPPTRQAVHAS